MKTVEATELEAQRRPLLRRLGRISSSSGKGFAIDIHHYLEEAGFTKVTAGWRGDDPCGFTVTGEFEGHAPDVARRLLTVLGDDLAYDDALAAVTTTATTVQVSFLTWAAELGVASICIDLTRSAEPTVASPIR